MNLINTTKKKCFVVFTRTLCNCNCNFFQEVHSLRSWRCCCKRRYRDNERRIPPATQAKKCIIATFHIHCSMFTQLGFVIFVALWSVVTWSVVQICVGYSSIFFSCTACDLPVIPAEARHRLTWFHWVASACQLHSSLFSDRDVMNSELLNAL